MDFKKFFTCPLLHSCLKIFHTFHSKPLSNQTLTHTKKWIHLDPWTFCQFCLKWTIKLLSWLWWMAAKWQKQTVEFWSLKFATCQRPLFCFNVECFEEDKDWQRKKFLLRGVDKCALCLPQPHVSTAYFPFVNGRCHSQNGRCHLKRSMPFFSSELHSLGLRTQKVAVTGCCVSLVIWVKVRVRVLFRVRAKNLSSSLEIFGLFFSFSFSFINVFFSFFVLIFVNIFS